MSHSTVNCFLSGISMYHKINDWEDNTQRFIIKKLKEGFKRSTRTKDSRLPITRDILTQIMQLLPSICHSTFEYTLFSSVFSLAFHGLFRIGELTVGNNNVADHTVLANNVNIQASMIEIRLSSSKTDQNGSGVTLQIPCQSDQTICPVSLLKSYLRIRPNVQGPLFCHFDHKPVTRYQFSAVLKKVISLLGLDSNCYKSHSFRIGMATTLSLEGYTDEEIQKLGRWKSNAFIGYIRLPC